MTNRWITCLLSRDSPLLQIIGETPGTYEVMFDLNNKVIRVRISGQEKTFPIRSAKDVLDLLNKTVVYNYNPKKPNEGKGSDLYPGANIWEDKGSYQVKHRFNETGKCTDIYMARPGLSRKQADNEHIHIYRVGETAQGADFKDTQGRVYNLSDHEISRILSGGASSLFYDKFFK